MRTTMTRQFTVNTIKVAEITFKDGNIVAIEMPSITAYGNITKEDATAIMRKKYGKKVNAVVVCVETKVQSYKAKIEDFIAIATPTDTDEPETEDTDEPETEDTDIEEKTV